MEKLAFYILYLVFMSLIIRQKVSSPSVNKITLTNDTIIKVVNTMNPSQYLKSVSKEANMSTFFDQPGNYTFWKIKFKSATLFSFDVLPEKSNSDIDFMLFISNLYK
jgi:hypothetical protein